MVDNKKLGIFPWYSLRSTSPATSIEFFKNLLGLSSPETEMPGMGKVTMLQKGDNAFADVGSLNKEMNSHWSTYMTVENVDAFLEKASRMGAKVNSSFEIPTIGWAAVVTDPCGAEFMAFTPLDWSMANSVMGMEEGMICWNDLMVEDPRKAMDFYGECMGWKFTKSEGMGNMEYHMITSMDGQKIGGIMGIPPKAENISKMWLPYMLTKDLNAAVKKVPELGGQVIMPPTEIPKTGFFSLIKDPNGCITYLFAVSQ